MWCHSVGGYFLGMGGPLRPCRRLSEAGNWKRWSTRFIAHHLLLSLVCDDTKVSVHFTLKVTSVSHSHLRTLKGSRRSCCFCQRHKQLRHIAWHEPGVPLLMYDVLGPQVSKQLNYRRNGWDDVLYIRRLPWKQKQDCLRLNTLYCQELLLYLMDPSGKVPVKSI